MKSKSVQFVATGAVVLVLGAALAGCGTTSGSTTTNSNSSGNSSANSTGSSGSSKGETLVLYSAQGYDQAMATAFHKATGITVKLVDDSTGPLIARAEAQGANSQWDVIWFDGPSSMQALDNQGMLLKNWTPNDVSNYNSLGQSLIPPDKSYYPGGVTGEGAIGYNPKYVSPSQLPKTLNALLSPKWKNQVSMPDPAVSGPTYPLVAGVIQQMGSVQKGEAFFSKLKQNGLVISNVNSDSINAVVNGQVKLAFVQDSALIGAQQKGDPIAIDYLQSGTYTLPDVMGINKNAPDMAAAKKFVEWVLSPAGQAVMSNPNNGGSDSYYEPVIKGVNAAPAAAKARAHVKWIGVNAVTAANEKNSVEAWFSANITKK
ncbi:ABC transporter substrate-binding protein [Alicyclobacillus sp. ALC3]|uniref:ABC transporter substrate-binding protein n=1 Tax=Alicyclobacillus sp. ALC3 TaxID=2796143 RepID=UPI0023783DA0|nr:extracellular solute-binding protein [Alicyclobacillus sp. ALC3]WDL96124.1 extracellular solute-binding protein [Alicyclobacillus sp. ALC3]